MFVINVVDGKERTLYMEGQHPKLFATAQEATEEIQSLRDMEQKLFGDITTRHYVTEVKA